MGNDTNWTNETLSYMIFMVNKWSENVCKTIYGDLLGQHIWGKYIKLVNSYGEYGAITNLVFELDSENLKKLIDFACSKYNGKSNR